jgi:hypothetical protein
VSFSQWRSLLFYKRFIQFFLLFLGDFLLCRSPDFVRNSLDLSLPGKEGKNTELAALNFASILRVLGFTSRCIPMASLESALPTAYDPATFMTERPRALSQCAWTESGTHLVRHALYDWAEGDIGRNFVPIMVLRHASHLAAGCARWTWLPSLARTTDGGVKCRPLSLYSCGFRDSELVKPEMSSYIQRRQTGLSQLHVCCSLEARETPRCIMVWIRLHKEGFPRTLYLLLVMNANQSLVQSHHDKKACIC